MKIKKRAGPSLRFMDQPPPAAGELVLSRDAGGFRHYLDGRPVPCGSLLERHVTDGVWMFVTYEASLVDQESPALLYTQAGVYPAIRSDRFRWPEER